MPTNESLKNAIVLGAHAGSSIGKSTLVANLQRQRGTAIAAAEPMFDLESEPQSFSRVGLTSMKHMKTTVAHDWVENDEWRNEQYVSWANVPMRILQSTRARYAKNSSESLRDNALVKILDKVMLHRKIPGAVKKELKRIKDMGA